MTHQHFTCLRKKHSKMVVPRILLTVCCAVWAADSVAADAAGQQVIVVVGAPGTPEYADQFKSWAKRWKQAAEVGQAPVQMLGVPDNDDVHSDSSPSAVHAESLGDASPVLRDRLLQSVRAASVQESNEPLWLVLIGHGTYDGRAARFNLRGPDISSIQLADALVQSKRPVAIINCSSCSAPFINALSGKDRVIVTATKSGQESQYSRFGDYLSAAIGSTDADLDRDDQTSLQEAWLVAAAATAAFYESDGRLATEHSLLDDNGDQAGSSTATYQNGRLRKDLKEPEKVDGRMAAKWHLIRSQQERLFNSAQRKQRDVLESQLEELRQQKSNLSEVEYLNQLEGIMLPLARLYQSVSQTHCDEN